MSVLGVLICSGYALIREWPNGVRTWNLLPVLELALAILLGVTFSALREDIRSSVADRKRAKVDQEEKLLGLAPVSTYHGAELPRTEHRKLVLCIDGTNDFAAARPTHPFRLAKMLKGKHNLVVYYDGGVGTLEDTWVVSKFKRKMNQAMDLAFGFSLRSNVVNAYTFLVENYKPGDEIYLFGFSRGAYACRVLVGLIKLFGLLEKKQKNLIPFLWQTYNNLESGWDKEHIDAIKAGLDLNDIKISYVGLWDTVSSVGYLRQRTFPYTASMPTVLAGRHAVAIDEHRNMFPENLVGRKSSVQEFWFAGVHRDIGGGGGDPDADPLCEIPFRWVLLPLKKQLDLVFCGNCDSTLKAWNQSEPMAVGYSIAGLFPQRIWTSEPTGGGRYRYYWFRLSHIRQPIRTVVIHGSVVDRVKNTDLKYLPTKFLGKNGNPTEPLDLVKIQGETKDLV
jgi:hypothetical protein